MEFKKTTYTYQGQDKLPNESWHPYFKNSNLGQSYEVLYEWENDAIGKLIMSDTEYELRTNLPFLEEVKKRGPGTKVLSIGYGIGFINDHMRQTGAHLTVVEKYPEVLELSEVPKDIRIVLGDINDVPLEMAFKPQEFDVIFADITYSWDFHREKELMSYLAPGGRFMYWTHMS